MIVYRLHRDTRNPFDYNLSRENRWNPSTTPMLYCGGSLSLCCLEVLVHTDPDLIPDNLVWSLATLPAEPEGFEQRLNIENIEQTRRFGKTWIHSRRALSIRVPSVIIPQTNADFNILLNPTHSGYSELQWQRGGAFSFDPRLFSNDFAI